MSCKSPSPCACPLDPRFHLFFLSVTSLAGAGATLGFCSPCQGPQLEVFAPTGPRLPSSPTFLQEPKDCIQILTQLATWDFRCPDSCHPLTPPNSRSLLASPLLCPSCNTRLRPPSPGDIAILHESLTALFLLFYLIIHPVCVHVPCQESSVHWPFACGCTLGFMATFIVLEVSPAPRDGHILLCMPPRFWRDLGACLRLPAGFAPEPSPSHPSTQSVQL